MAFRGAIVLFAAFVLGGCASAAPLSSVLRAPAPAPLIRFGVDTFAFPNESRTKNQGKPDLYANYCFVMVRAVTQFHRFARFDPAAAHVSSAEYTELVKQVTSHAPWSDPLPIESRVVIPGYRSLYDLSNEQEAAVKAGLPSRFWTFIHWTNWRVIFPFPGSQQEAVASQTVTELQDGHVVQFLITNLPQWELNHTVLVYDYRIGDNGAVEFVVYDPNDPYVPGVITFDRAARHFMATHLFDTTPGGIRAFRMYYSPLL
jgi:hypothetical protein